MSTESDKLLELLAISRAIAGTTKYDEVLRLVVDKACALTNFDASLLLLATPGAHAQIAASSGVECEALRDFHGALDERIVDELRRILALEPRDAIVAVPMILRGDVRGVLAVVRRCHVEQAPDVEGPDLVAVEFLLSALADQAANALGHAAHLSELERALSAADRERHAREEVLAALAAERSWLRAVIENSPVAILLVEGASASRVKANARAEQLFGRHIAERGGSRQYANQICLPDGTPVPYEQVPSIAAMRGETVHRELSIRRRDGTDVPVLVNAAAICDEQSKTLGAVVLYEDLSTLKRLERLRQEWTGIVAHDLRQPLSAIVARAQMLARNEGERVQRDVDRIIASADRLNRMIRDLSDASRIDTSRLTLSRTSQPLASILTETIENCAAMARDHPLELVVDDELPSVYVDVQRVEQVLANLITNAVKYGAPASPIEITADVRDTEVEVTVKNQGPGIAPEDIPSLFQRFQRGKVRNSMTEGLGLGLYICKGLIEAHGGRIWVESSPGQTTAFHFTLPLAGECRDPEVGSKRAKGSHRC